MGASVPSTLRGALEPWCAIGATGALRVEDPPGGAIYIVDGRLSYASENVVEAFYALQLFKGLTATADYQLLVNPAYNTDRGPVHVFSGRLHASF